MFLTKGSHCQDQNLQYWPYNHTAITTVNYDRKTFIVQATGFKFIKPFFSLANAPEKSQSVFDLHFFANFARKRYTLKYQTWLKLFSEVKRSSLISVMPKDTKKVFENIENIFFAKFFFLKIVAKCKFFKLLLSPILNSVLGKNLQNFLRSFACQGWLISKVIYIL